jgi:hypothetical protein
MRTEHDVGRHQPKSPPLSWRRFCDGRGRAARQALIFRSAGRPGKSRDWAHFAIKDERDNWPAQAYRRWRYRRAFSILIWQIASLKRQFEGSTFDQSAAAFGNPDHGAIVIHNDH